MDNELTGVPTYTSVRKLIILSFLFFILPFLGFLAVNMYYGTTLYQSESLHTIATLITSALSLFVAFLGYTLYADSEDIRIMFIIFAFFTFGSVFAIHALSLPSLEIASQKFFEITEHYSLFFVSLLVFMGASLPALSAVSETYRKQWRLIVSTQVFIFFFFVVTFVSTTITNLLAQTIAVPIVLTGILFLGGLIKLVQQYTLDHNRFIVHIILGISVILNNAIVPFFYQEWNATWWYFHFILGLSFLVASLGILISWFSNPGAGKTW